MPRSKPAVSLAIFHPEREMAHAPARMIQLDIKACSEDRKLVIEKYFPEQVRAISLEPYQQRVEFEDGGVLIIYWKQAPIA